jgi:hypothetical protein
LFFSADWEFSRTQSNDDDWNLKKIKNDITLPDFIIKKKTKTYHPRYVEVQKERAQYYLNDRWFIFSKQGVTFGFLRRQLWTFNIKSTM